jgi:hypothetical protein
MAFETDRRWRGGDMLGTLYVTADSLQYRIYAHKLVRTLPTAGALATPQFRDTPQDGLTMAQQGLTWSTRQTPEELDAALEPYLDLHELLPTKDAEGNCDAWRNKNALVMVCATEMPSGVLTVDATLYP